MNMCVAKTVATTIILSGFGPYGIIIMTVYYSEFSRHSWRKFISYIRGSLTVSIRGSDLREGDWIQPMPGHGLEAGFREHANEHLGAIKAQRFLTSQV
jgi:hypothetical protein